jgi:hypothetical protein
LLLRRHPPYGIADVIGNEERAGAVDGDADRPAPGIAVVARKPVRTSMGSPLGLPLANGTNTTYAASLANWTGSTIEGSSFSGLLTRVEIGQIRIKSAGNGRIRSRGSGSSLSHRV